MRGKSTPKLPLGSGESEMHRNALQCTVEIPLRGGSGLGEVVSSGFDLWVLRSLMLRHPCHRIIHGSGARPEGPDGSPDGLSAFRSNVLTG